MLKLNKSEIPPALLEKLTDIEIGEGKGFNVEEFEKLMGKSLEDIIDTTEICECPDCTARLEGKKSNQTVEVVKMPKQDEDDSIHPFKKNILPGEGGNA